MEIPTLPADRGDPAGTLASEEGRQCGRGRARRIGSQFELESQLYFVLAEAPWACTLLL